ncbi:hypothetical protein ACJX0J_041617, partial [Zea mays]
MLLPMIILTGLLQLFQVDHESFLWAGGYKHFSIYLENPVELLNEAAKAAEKDLWKILTVVNDFNGEIWVFIIWMFLLFFDFCNICEALPFGDFSCGTISTRVSYGDIVNLLNIGHEGFAYFIFALYTDVSIIVSTFIDVEVTC